MPEPECVPQLLEIHLDRLVPPGPPMIDGQGVGDYFCGGKVPKASREFRILDLRFVEEISDPLINRWGIISRKS